MIDNYLNKNISVNNTNTFNVSSVSTNKEENVSKSAIPIVDVKKQELLKQLGITLEQYDAIKAKVNDFDSLNIEQQLAVVSSFKNETIDETQNSAEQEKVEQPKTAKQLYNEKTLDEKIKDCFEVFAKNTYIYGVKDKNGNVIAQAHGSEEAWNNLSEAEKQAEIEKIKTFINKDERLKNVKEAFISATDKNPKLKEAAADSVMRGLQTAEFNGISYLEFLQKDEFERLNLENDYLITQDGGDTNSLNASDKARMKEFSVLKTQVGKIVSAKIGEDVTDNLDSSDVAKYMKYYNLDKSELLYNAISEKPVESRTKQEQAFIENFGKLGLIRNKAKAQNLISLQDELNSYESKLQNGETLSSEETGHYNILKEYLASDDAKNLKEVADNLPKPKTDYDKSVAKDVENFQSQIKDFIHGSDIETAASLSFLETKTKGMSEKEKAKYINSFLKYYNSEASVNVFGIYANKFKNLWADKDNVDKATLNIVSADSEATNDVINNINLLRTSDNPYQNKVAASLTITGNEALQETSSPDQDDKKGRFVNLSSKFTNAEVQQSGFNLITTITNEDKQNQAVIDLQTSENATDELQVYAVDNADKLKGKAQLTSVDISTQKSDNALKRVSENGVVAKLETENQQAAMNMFHERIEDRFDKEEAIKYSNMLADQIKDCDKSNQLAMHNEMMNSKYSEVQEHVAGNIKDYDPTVQTDALETVLKSGNEKAIESAVENVKYAPDCVKSEMNKAVEAYVTEQAIQNDNTIVSSLVEISSSFAESIKSKIASGQLLSEDELSTLSMTEKREYFSNFFKKLPVDKKIKILASMPDSQKKTVYTLIARTNPTLFNEIVKDKDRSDQLLSMGLPEDVNNKIKGVVSFLAVSDVGFQNIASKYDIEYDNGSQEVKNKPYHTVPQEFDTKEIYKRDKFGNILT